MKNNTIVLVKSVTSDGNVDNYSVDFEEIKLGEALALGCLKSFIDSSSNNWNIITINPLIQKLTAREVADLTIAEEPFLVGISMVYQWHRNFALSISKQIKAALPYTHIILGGLSTSSDWVGLLNMGQGAFDSICKGEGEYTFLELAQNLWLYKEWRDTAGIAYLENKLPVFRNPRKRIADLGVLPFPDRSQSSAIFELGGVIQVEGSRGCNGGCTFCDAHHTGWIGRPVQHLADEVELLSKQFPGNDFWFIDNIFIGFGKERFSRIHKLIDEFQKRNISIRFSFQDRAENIQEEFFSRLNEVGLTRVYIGIESFSDTALNRWNKGSTASSNKQALHVLNKVGVFTQIGFLVFDDGTTMQEIYENIVGLKETSFNNPYIHLHNFNELIPYSGTFLEKEYERKYGAKPDPQGANIWHFADENVKHFRNWAWKYLEKMWPLSECIFHNFDSPIFQQDFPTILPIKNNHFIAYLEELYPLVINHSPNSEIENCCQNAIQNTKKSLLACTKHWSNPQTLEVIRDVIHSISTDIRDSQ